MNDKICHKVRNHCHYTGKYGSAKHGKYNSKYSVPKEMLIIFRKWSNYDYHFITKKLAKKIEKKLLRKRKRRKRSTRTEKKKEKKKRYHKTWSYWLQVIDSARFMASSLLDLSNKFAK